MKPEICRAVGERIEGSIRGYVGSAGKRGVVLGMSGGIDSALVGSLSAGGLGRENVFCYMLPFGGRDVEDGVLTADHLGIRYEVVTIDDIVRAAARVSKCPCDDKIRFGNLQARARMMILYDKAAENGMIVIGTGNRSEAMVGYCTKYGDHGVDLQPIGDLFKTEIFELSRFRRLPQKIIDKTPSAGLWDGQTDEGQLGITYADLDKILRGDTQGMDPERVEYVDRMVRASEHKRKAPPTIHVRDLIDQLCLTNPNAVAVAD